LKTEFLPEVENLEAIFLVLKFFPIFIVESGLCQFAKHSSMLDFLPPSALGLNSAVS
jgi:hypothetical protein